MSEDTSWIKYKARFREQSQHFDSGARRSSFRVGKRAYRRPQWHRGRSCRLPLTCGKVFDVMLSRPDSTEYAEFYKNYIARVPDGNVLDFLAQQPSAYRQLLAGIPDAAAEAEPEPVNGASSRFWDISAMQSG
jgi:hypothetical protein